MLEAVTVLIETYWNVNIYASQLKTRRIYVLIETYWNVNTITDLNRSLPSAS